ncbi:MAG: recombination protein O N-terminal domain-containing protein [Candidatus Paceibacterota bacterium]|jgi:recombinational DNA repair protein (RecF pathway)
MAYRHYETEGLVIGHRNLGEANRLYQILTHDFGLINVLAQSVRRDRSKLRQHLNNFSFVRLVLVRGREFWRVVGVSDLGLAFRSNKESLSFLKKISLVLQRLIHGEDSRSLSYVDLKQAVLLLSEEVLTGKDLENLEVFIMARLLIQLGYLAPVAELKTIFSSENFSWREIRMIENYRVSLVKQINQALEVTHL